MSKNKLSFSEIVIDLHFNQDMSTYEIADKLNTYPNKVRRAIIKSGRKPKNKSEAQKVALDNGRSTHPTEGRERTDEEKLKISSTLVTYWENMSDEDKEIRVQALKDRWEAMSDVQKHRMRQLATEALKEASNKGSKIENKIYEVLTKAGYSIEFHKKDLIRNDKLEIDLYIPELKTIIEVDGPSHFLPVWGEDKLRRQIDADARKDGLVLSQGFVMIRVKLIKTKLSLKHEKDLTDLIIKKLKKIEKHFPRKTNRYIEVEL